MIQYYKLQITDKNVLDNLDKVTPWWTRKVDNKLKKSRNMILKFGLNPNDFIKFSKSSETDYEGLIAGVNNYLNFYIPKIKIIVSNRVAFKKFDNSIINYMNLNGYVSAIQTIAEFYYSNKDDEFNQITKINAVKFANNKNFEKWKRYQKEVISNFGGNDEIKNNLKKIFSEVIEFKKDLFDPRVIIGVIVKYSSRLFKANEITEQQFLNLMYFSYLQLSYIEGFIDIYIVFLNNLK
ncbi:hypothetical protein [Mesoplasma corruscae]|uniref:Uncharacterized protein n=1 Tax=Mesoplasma corruscae TaxID=216874 RepID=A0A2S5RG44_9MOLU|nr:hypothetical protein [Mesoplasma corruscae]PPE06306.1 hypothetical protein MCORR_v1c06110 [Mesoplasma corruscae]